MAQQAKTEREKTSYVVLAKDEGYDKWKPVKTGDAANAEAAIRAYTETVAADDTPNDGAGTYVAVPARSWRPVTVKTETKTVLKLT